MQVRGLKGDRNGPGFYVSYGDLCPVFVVVRVFGENASGCDLGLGRECGKQGFLQLVYES